MNFYIKKKVMFFGGEFVRNFFWGIFLNIVSFFLNFWVFFIFILLVVNERNALRACFHTKMRF